MYIYIILVFNFVIKHALFRHDNHRFDSNSRLLPVQYFAGRYKSDNSIVFFNFYFPKAITQTSVLSKGQFWSICNSIFLFLLVTLLYNAFLVIK